MRTYVAWTIGILVFAAVMRLVCLALLDYPRNVKNSRGDDAVGVVVYLAMAAWGAWIMWGAN